METLTYDTEPHGNICEFEHIGLYRLPLNFYRVCSAITAWQQSDSGLDFGT